MESWRKVWRVGFAHQISRAGLIALRKALLERDETLVQGRTAVPGFGAMDVSVEGGCALAYAGWKGLGLNTVREVTLYFLRLCENAAPPCSRVLESYGSFIDWFDQTPMRVVVEELVPEIDEELRGRRYDVRKPVLTVAEEIEAVVTK